MARDRRAHPSMQSSRFPGTDVVESTSEDRGSDRRVAQHPAHSKQQRDPQHCPQNRRRSARRPAPGIDTFVRRHGWTHSPRIDPTAAADGFRNAPSKMREPAPFRARVRDIQRPVRDRRMPVADDDAIQSAASSSSAYSSGVSSDSSSPVSSGLRRKIQPSPQASSLMISGLSVRSSLTATTCPATGA